jgi:hypothetical protein
MAKHAYSMTCRELPGLAQKLPAPRNRRHLAGF